MLEKLSSWEKKTRGRGIRGGAGRLIRNVWPRFQLSSLLGREQTPAQAAPTAVGTFQYDWFTWNTPFFEKYLAHLRGKPCQALEVGCHEGRASTWMLQNILTHPDSRLTAIDLYLQENFWDNIKSAGGLEKTQLIVKPSREALRQLPFSKYDFIYIDASHWTIDVLEDAVLSFRLAKVGGVIGFDDYLWDDERWNQESTPKAAIGVFLKIYKAKIELLEQNQQVWVRKLAD